MCARQLCRASGSVRLKITADTAVFTPRRRSEVIIRGGLQASNKCPCVIDYTLQANEINTAWIDWVEITPGGRRGRGGVDTLMFRVAVEKQRTPVLVFWAESSFFSLSSRPPSDLGIADPDCSGRQQLVGFDKLCTWQSAAEEKKTLSPVEGKRHQRCESTSHQRKAPD